MVDVPKGIEEYMPEDYKERLEYVTHETDSNVNLEEKTREMLQMYKEQAQLVVTSRLHCASPCMAMGIPVILVREYYDSRYKWIDKYLPLYTSDKFSTIDWNPKSVDLEDMKDKLVHLFECAMNRDEGLGQAAADVNNEYMDRERAEFQIPIKTRMYWKMLALNPKLAYYIRKKLLKRFTVMNEGDK